MSNWELELAALRPTQKPWKCSKCGIELLGLETIKGHMQRCPGKIKKQRTKTIHELQREAALTESLRKFKQRRGM